MKSIPTDIFSLLCIARFYVFVLHSNIMYNLKGVDGYAIFGIRCSEWRKNTTFIALHLKENIQRESFFVIHYISLLEYEIYVHVFISTKIV